MEAPDDLASEHSPITVHLRLRLHFGKSDRRVMLAAKQSTTSLPPKGRSSTRYIVDDEEGRALSTLPSVSAGQLSRDPGTGEPRTRYLS
jgi:hypothetical protein